MVDAFPLWWANAITIVLFVMIVIACWWLPRQAVFSDAPDQAVWRDLRVWATALAAVQIGIYLLFG